MNKSVFDLVPFETSRLVVRKTSVDDVYLLLKMDKQELTQKFLGGIKNKTKEERISFLEKSSSSLTMCLKDGTAVGFVDLKVKNNRAELSYIFDSDYWNQGYCTEACKKIIDICFNDLDIDSICADTVEGNDSSKRVLEKLGFEYVNSVGKDPMFLNYILFNKR